MLINACDESHDKIAAASHKIITRNVDLTCSIDVCYEHMQEHLDSWRHGGIRQDTIYQIETIK